MPHQHKSITYQPADIPNPFLDKNGDRAYGEILLDKTKEAKAWRLTGIAHVALFVVSIIILVVALSMQKTVPVLINVMPSGEAVNLGEVRQSGSFQVPEAAIFYQIRKFISNFRSVSIDGEVLFNNINECYAMVTTTYNPVMTRILRDPNTNPFELVGRVRRTVEIESTLKITGNSYQVDWLETNIETGGNPRSRKMRALVTIKLITPDNSFIRANPLGIFIENCEWTEL